MLATGVGDVRGRIVVVHDHIRGQTGARVVALDQVVRQQRVLGKPAMRRDLERIDIVDALARERAFTEEILIHVRDGRRIRIDARMARRDRGEA